jgi:hypothetical protein
VPQSGDKLQILKSRLKYFYSDNKFLIWIGIINFIILYASSFTRGYGYFIDEFYYIACSNHPALGYVDQPPLAPIVLFIFKTLFGSSVFAIRILPAIAFLITIIFTGLIARQLGGNKSAQVLSAVCLLCSPVYSAMAGFYSMNAFEPLIAVIVFYVLIKMVNEGNTKHWLLIGLLFGLALMNKHTAGVYIAFIPLALLLTPQRKILFNNRFILCVIISFFIFLPDILWNVLNGYPTIEFYKNITLYKNVPTPPLQFFLNQFQNYSPFVVPFGIAGALFLIFSKEMKNFRFAGYVFIFVYLFFMLTKTSRIDRLAFIYPLVIPAGAILFENVMKNRILKKLKYIVYFLLIAWFCLIIPLLNPYVSYENTASLAGSLGMNTELEKGNKPLIPQTLADRIGWEEKVDMLEKVYKSINDTLSGNKKGKIAFFAENYGMAGAIELYGKEKLENPDVICAHNNYYFWSMELLRKINPEYILAVSHRSSYNNFKKSFNEVDSTWVNFDNQYCTPHERNLTVYICSKPKKPPLELFENSKFFY